MCYELFVKMLLLIISELQRKCIFLQKKLLKYLVSSKKCSNFAPAFEEEHWWQSSDEKQGYSGSRPYW